MGVDEMVTLLWPIDTKADIQKRKHDDKQLLNEIDWQEDLIKKLYEGK